MALISIKDVKQAIRITMQILEKLDEIYHALHDSINENEKEQTMMHKTWNIRDQTEEALRTKVESLYKEIEKSYKLIKKLS